MTQCRNKSTAKVLVLKIYKYLLNPNTLNPGELSTFETIKSINYATLNDKTPHFLYIKAPEKTLTTNSDHRIIAPV